MRFRAFPERVGPRTLSLESVDFFETSEHFSSREKKKTKKKNRNQQNVDGEAN